jgi:hypothetical protein
MRTSKFFPFVFAIAMMTGIFACKTGEQEIKAARKNIRHDSKFIFQELAIMSSVQNPDSSSENAQKQEREAKRPFMDQLEELRRQYAGKVTVEKAPDLDRQVQTLLAQHRQNPYFYSIQQEAAAFVQYDAPEIRPIIGFYTEQLDAANTPSVGLMYFCLERLQDYWGSRKISEVRDRALRNLEKSEAVGKKSIEKTLAGHTPEQINDDYLLRWMSKLMEDNRIYSTKIRTLASENYKD